MVRGVARAAPGASIDRVPMADGGEGTVEALVAATGGSYREAGVTGPWASRSSLGSACSATAAPPRSRWRRLRDWCSSRPIGATP